LEQSKAYDSWYECNGSHQPVTHQPVTHQILWLLTTYNKWQEVLEKPSILWTIEEVGTFLETHSLSKHIPQVEAEKINGKVLWQLTEYVLTEKLNLTYQEGRQLIDSLLKNKDKLCSNCPNIFTMLPNTIQNSTVEILCVAKILNLPKDLHHLIIKMILDIHCTKEIEAAPCNHPLILHLFT